ncbi:hypothetical protein QQF64_000214 [Cirrhinus molitorella]|uniref:Integrase catalytic domain-containing protein n=1 Tax=Cirrhinus molitorella TaxID=172907 RepID=A0ABR3NWN9_9TELE
MFADFLKEKGISHIHSSLYYPQGSAAVESWNKVLKECILSAEQMVKLWKYAPQSMTGVYPSELLHLRKMHTKLNIFPVGPKSDKCAQVKDTVSNKQRKSKTYTDKRCGAKYHTFKPGNQVKLVGVTLELM